MLFDASACGVPCFASGDYILAGHRLHMDSSYGAVSTPRSVMMPVTYFCRSHIESPDSGSADAVWRHLLAVGVRHLRRAALLDGDAVARRRRAVDRRPRCSYVEGNPVLLRQNRQQQYVPDLCSPRRRSPQCGPHRRPRPVSCPGASVCPPCCRRVPLWGMLSCISSHARQSQARAPCRNGRASRRRKHR